MSFFYYYLLREEHYGSGYLDLRYWDFLDIDTIYCLVFSLSGSSYIIADVFYT